MRTLQASRHPTANVATEAAAAAVASEPRILEELHKILAEMSPECRRRSLSNLFSQSQRLILEAFVLGHRRAACQHQVPLATPENIAGESLVVKAKVEPSKRKRKAEIDNELPAGLIANPQSNGCYYSAQVALGSLRLLSRSDRDLPRVKAFHAVLMDIHGKLAGTQGAESDFELQFRSAVEGALLSHDVDARALGLRFYVSLKPTWASRPLRTRPFNFANEADFQMGVSAFQRLEAARGQGRSQVRGPKSLASAAKVSEVEEALAKLRDVYREVMLEAACSPLQVEARLAALTQEQISGQERMMERCRQAHLKREQRCLAKQRRLAAKKAPVSLSRQERAVRRLLQRWKALERSAFHRQEHRKAKSKVRLLMKPECSTVPRQTLKNKT